jgi:hypothetical protein
MDKKSRNKIVIFILFLILIIGGGYMLSRKIDKNGIQKTGYKTEHNPSFIDSSMKSKKSK